MSRKKFILLINTEDKLTSKKIIKFFSDNQWSWWHHFPNSWLFIDHTGESNCKIIRDEIKSRIGIIPAFIVELKGDTWSGMLKTNTSKWIKENWTNKKIEE